MFSLTKVDDKQTRINFSDPRKFPFPRSRTEKKKKTSAKTSPIDANATIKERSQEAKAKKRRRKGNCSREEGAKHLRSVQKVFCNSLSTFLIRQATFRTTKRNVEILQHQQAKHPSNTFEECFPGETHE